MRRMLLGVGNRLGRDDGAGPELAVHLADSEWIAVDCGTSLENVAGIVCREDPDLLVIADAARMGLAPGSVRRLPRRAAADSMLGSTHGLPMSFFLDRLAELAAETVLLGIEPEDLAWGEGLTPTVAAAIRSLAERLTDETGGVASVEWLAGEPPADGSSRPVEGAPPSR